MANLSKYTMYELLTTALKDHPNSVAQMYRPEKNDPYKKVTHQEFFEKARAIGLGLDAIGLKRGDKVGFIADVGPVWLPVSMGITTVGGVDVPRGTDATQQELLYIFKHADCPIIILDNEKVFNSISANLADFTNLKTIIFVNAAKPQVPPHIKVYALDEIIASGKSVHAAQPNRYAELGNSVGEEDLVTIIYTSGTTGNPKGVMHSNKSLTWEISHVGDGINFKPNGVTMGFLPPWHVAERLIESVALTKGCAIAFTGVATLAKDLAEARPTFLLSVPRVWESLYNRVMDNVKKASPIARGLFNFSRWAAMHFSIEKDILANRKYRLEKPSVFYHLFRRPLALLAMIGLLVPNLLAQVILGKVRKGVGGRVEFALSGAGALPEHIDRFFYSIGIAIVETYGMTETGGVTCRRTYPGTVIGTVGKTIAGTKVKLLDEQGNEVTKPNTKGVCWHYGPHIMKGYYKEEQKTKEVLKDGWLNSGDILVYTANGELKFAGRAKDTIVLFGGENVEPQPIEDTLIQSEYIHQIVVVGQDKKTLGALIVPAKEAVQKYATEKKISLPAEMRDWPVNAEIQKLFKTEIKERVSEKAGFKNFEKVTTFAVIPDEFKVGDELTQTLKVRRNVVFDKYAKQIEEMYK
ncbi:MAG: AMP-binding protein [Turneriella sp.]|nr:AMP-binding protein [Turneriella sp.]